MSLFCRLKNTIRDFGRNEAGNYLMMFAIGLPAIMGAFSVGHL